jgi:TadE-like protein
VANKLLRDVIGSVLVEYTIVFPIFILLILGTVDVSYMLFEWALASKAAYVGARTAAVSNPVAQNITSPNNYTADQVQKSGQLCFYTSAPDTPLAPNGNCPSLGCVCTPAISDGTCADISAIYTCPPGWSEKAFTNTNGTGIFDRMITIFPRLTRQNVQISYQTNNLGFVGQTDLEGRPGLSMNVTVSIRCMTHQFFFINALMGWVFSGPPAGCPAGAAGPAIPAFASTLQSENMLTN